MTTEGCQAQSLEGPSLKGWRTKRGLRGIEERVRHEPRLSQEESRGWGEVTSDWEWACYLEYVLWHLSQTIPAIYHFRLSFSAGHPPPGI